ncbi:MAG: hypothetical protein AAFQ87_01005 [Bacteroidota bacterium]
MNRLIWISFLIGLLPVPSLAQERANEPMWPKQAISVHAGSNLLSLPVVLNYERYLHREKVHWGFGTGINGLVPLPDFSRGIGTHATVSFWTGQGRHHFEAKGGIILGFYEFPGIFQTWALPLLSVGYRRQEPASNRFWRIDLGTGGLGFGYGWTF